MRTRPELTYGMLRDLLTYDPPTGVLRWVTRPANNVWRGDVAGTVTKRGYRMVRILGVNWLAHRLAWFWMTGRWPTEDIDHINGIKSDNRWCNLREATRAQNIVNRPPGKNNTSGSRGVSFYRPSKKWRAQLSNGTANRYIGTFNTKEDAERAYNAAAKAVYGEFVYAVKA